MPTLDKAPVATTKPKSAAPANAAPAKATRKPTKPQTTTELVKKVDIATKRGLATNPKSPLKPQTKAKKGPTTASAPASKKAVAAAGTVKSEKSKKPKMVRDSMTMPKAEYAVLADLKLRASNLTKPIKKTELLRAGVKALAAMSDANFLAALRAVPSLKTGRPSKT